MPAGSQGNAFDFLDRPPRDVKPRQRGLTVASDRGLSHADAKSVVETMGDILDHIKCPDHVGNMWRWPADWIKQKNAYYDSVGIHTLPGGIPFEVAAMQGKVPHFMERVAELGFTGVEVSEDSIEPLSQGERVAAIRCGIDAGLEVFTELGKKNPEKPLDPVEAVEMAHRDLDAGAILVVVEKSDVALCIKNKSDALHRMVEGVGKDKIIIECGPGADKFEIAKWLMREFGTDINLENIDTADAPIIEAMRHGMNRAVDYSYFHQFKGVKAPPIHG
jgi:phosphosulfolactate synthase